MRKGGEESGVCRLTFESETEEKRVREDDGVKYGGLQRSGDEGFLAAAHEVCISNLFLSLMLGIRVRS